MNGRPCAGSGCARRGRAGLRWRCGPPRARTRRCVARPRAAETARAGSPGRSGRAACGSRRGVIDLDLVPQRARSSAHVLTSVTHDAVDLRLPGVGDDQDPHRAAVGPSIGSERGRDSGAALRRPVDDPASAGSTARRRASRRARSGSRPSRRRCSRGCRRSRGSPPCGCGRRRRRRSRGAAPRARRAVSNAVM